MADLDFYDLPTDVEQAFPVFEGRLRDRHLDEDFGPVSIDNKRDYAIGLIGFCSAYEVDISYDLTSIMSWDADEFHPAFDVLEAKARILSVQYSLRSNLKRKSGIEPTYVLDAAQKSNIHAQLNIIRDIISNSELTDQKRDALTKRLNAFAEEVDRNRTRGEALLAFYVSAKREVKEFADLTDHLEIIIRLLSKAKELADALSAPTVPKQISGPKQSNKNVDLSGLDDEIPF